MMKKIVIIVTALLLGAFAAVAQPKAIGLRGGPFEQEISYEHWLTLFDNDYDFLEAELGVFGGNGFKATAMYNFTLAFPEFTDRGDASWSSRRSGSAEGHRYPWRPVR